MATDRKHDNQRDKNYFADQRAQFFGLVKHALFIGNKIGRQRTDPRRGLASWLFMRGCVSAKSIEVLLTPQSTDYGGVYLDHASITSLCRGLIETMAVLLYVGDICISDDEWECRRSIIDIHDYKNRTKFLTLIDQLKSESQKGGSLEKTLSDNAFFQTLPKKQQKRLLDGEDMFVHGRHKALLAFGWGDNFTRGIYKYLSQQAHSQSMAFHRTETNKIYEEDSPYVKVVAGFAIESAKHALGAGSLHMAALFPYIEAGFDPLIFAALKSEFSRGSVD